MQNVKVVRRQSTAEEASKRKGPTARTEEKPSSGMAKKETKLPLMGSVKPDRKLQKNETNKVEAKLISELKVGLTKKRVGADRRNMIPFDQFKKQTDLKNDPEKKSKIEEEKLTKASLRARLKAPDFHPNNIIHYNEEFKNNKIGDEECHLNHMRLNNSNKDGLASDILQKLRDKFEYVDSMPKGQASFGELRSILANEKKSGDEKVDALKQAHDAISRYKAVLRPEEKTEMNLIEDKTYAREKLRSRILRQLFDECLDDVVKEVNTNHKIVKKKVFQPCIEGMITDIEDACKELDTFDSDMDPKLLQNLDKILLKWREPLNREAKKQIYKQSFKEFFTQRKQELRSNITK
ncbi:uncharacterized protein LOC106672771 [Cimex lectularius]|uniref:Uncharacterized protein n=1 Tax=Cimex lectularius TaxID=79782 RepID=A0A8I6S974_CIMLE|nr:uncharacterized protein LOC106672771 [Cimex lectularius]